MKNLTKILILTILIIATLNTSALASTEVPCTNILKEGIYKISETGGSNIKPGKCKIELISPDSVVYVYIIDSNTIERFSKRFISTSPHSKGTLLEGDYIIILGKGEIYISTAPM
ncbi:hypothetical protein [Clostridium sp.]|uniref:hypothetical protein n=1 Tax=Clostridium sp. TaxID=1506 RepID=UPI003217D8AA